MKKWTILDLYYGILIYYVGTSAKQLFLNTGFLFRKQRKGLSVFCSKNPGNPTYQL